MRPRNPTEDEYQAMLGRRGMVRAGRSLPVKSKRVVPAGASAVPSPRSIYKSKLEAAFAQYLDMLKMAKEIAGWSYEPLHWRLPGKKNWYKSDFCSWGNSNDPVMFYEVKGRNKSDATSLVKLKTAAALNPWGVFIQVRWVDGHWEEREMTV